MKIELTFFLKVLQALTITFLVCTPDSVMRKLFILLFAKQLRCANRNIFVLHANRKVILRMVLLCTAFI